MSFVNLSQNIGIIQHGSARLYINIINFARTKTITSMVRKLLFFAVLLTGCATPKAVEEQMGGWHEEMTSAINVAIQSQQTEQESSEQQKERVTETITTWVDSLGREMRQVQRTTERDISRQQRMWEQQLQRQYEERLQAVTDSMGQVWQTKFDAMHTHWAKEDSTSVSEKPVPADNRSWWEKTREMLKWIVIGAVLAIMLWISRKR